MAGTQYRLHFVGGGSEDVTDHAVTQEELDSHQTADWALEPADVNVWLPRYGTPPDQSQAGATEYHAPDSRQTQGNGDPTIGQVKENGTYSWQENSTTHTESYSCSGDLHGRRSPAGRYRLVVWQVNRQAPSKTRTVTFWLR